MDDSLKVRIRNQIFKFEATIENARKYSTKDSAVIMHTVGSLFAQHFKVYDTNEVKKVYLSDPDSDFLEERIKWAERDFPEWKIKELYILSKN